MNTQVFRRAALGLTLAAFPFLGGCDTKEDASVPGLITAALAEPAVPTVAANTAQVSPVPEATEPPAEKPAAPPVPAGEAALPPSIKPSSPLAEIIKLAQSGVEEAVLLTYITNSSSTFGLGADEIVYLNDIGLPGEVITTMMEHDKAMKHLWASAAQTQPQSATAPAAEAPAEQTAAAPSYANPPQAQPVPEAPPANINYNYFYDTLSPYGSWINVDGYGMCWQPSTVVVNRGWRPYCDGGRWIYTDAGWYWYSDYTWGWAPFHYGRWFSHPSYGWCWNPGYTWGPSWVSWRYTDGYCGWAPLPPAAHYSSGLGFTYYGSSVGVSFGFGLGYDCYTFVAWNRFCNYRPSRYCAPRHQGRQIYNNSTVVNNVIIGDNNTIINRGVPVERVAAATKSEIHQVAIRDVASVSGRDARRERLDRDGRTLAVHRPQSQNSSASTGFTKSEVRQPRAGAGGRPMDLQTGESRNERMVEQRPSTSRPVQKDELTQANRRTTFAGEKPGARPASPTAQTRNPVAIQDAPTPASRPAPPPKPIDVPSTKSVSGSTRTASSENSPTGGSPGTVPPLIVRGSERVNEPAASRPTIPQANAPSRTGQSPSSMVVIGKKENLPFQRQGNDTVIRSQTRSSEPARPQTSTVTPERQEPSRQTAPQRQFSQPQASAPTATRNWSPTAPQPFQRQESPRPTRSAQPSYSAPVQRPSTPAPAPRFTPRPSAPSAPSAPPAQFNRPAPAAPVARPQPAPPPTSAPRSAPPPAARQESSSRSSDSRSRGRN